MGDLIPFPLPNGKLNKEETLEYYELKAELKKATTFRDLRIIRKKINDFLKKVQDK